MQRDHKPQTTAQPVQEPVTTVLDTPMIVTDARGRPFYVSLTALTLDPHWLVAPQADEHEQDLGLEVVRWRV
jgi:hypothetical protein